MLIVNSVDINGFRDIQAGLNECDTLPLICFHNITLQVVWLGKAWFFSEATHEQNIFLQLTGSGNGIRTERVLTLKRGEMHQI